MREGVNSRYAHSEGHTALCYTNDGSHIITCGSDCDLRRWESNMDEDDSLLSITLREPATCIVARSDVVYIGSGHFVEAYKYPELKFSERPLQFSAAVTDVDISSDGKILVAGACDMKIKIKNLSTKEITELSSHTAPILRVVFNPDAKYMASSSCDGSVKVWDTSTGGNVKTFKNIIPTGNDFFTAESLGSPIWCEVSGSCLAVINHTKVCFYSISDWSLAFELTCKNIKKNISVISMSQHQHLLCAGTSIGEIIVWDLKERKVTKYLEDLHKATITAMSWNPYRLEFACCDRLGRVCLVSTEGKQDEDDEDKEDDEVQKEDSGKINDDEDEENVISISEIKASTMFTDDNALDDDNYNENEADDCRSSIQVPAPIKTDFQPAFQPSSTPSHFEHGYMVWNSVGIVLSFNSDVESSIDVEFHDTMLHHAIHRRNNLDYTMATLSTKVLCLASSSLITCIHVNGWDEKKEWSLDMPEEESITAVASSGNWVCCATDLNQLRFFVYSGMQRQIVSLPGRVVCMNGHETLLIVVIHMGVGVPGCQNLAYRIFEVTDFFIKAVTPFQPLPLSPEAKLKWVGFTDEGTPCTYDSAGILRLSRDFLNWEVVCNIGKHCKNKSDNYFLIGVNERLQCSRCILCKGSWYPMTLPRPTVVEIPLKIPMCNPDDNKTINEDRFWRHVFSLAALVEPSRENDEYKDALKAFEKDLMQTIMKLFAEAHRNRADMRAVSLASLMNERPLEMAVKLVVSDGRYLSEKIRKIMPKDWNELRQGPTRDVSPAQYVGLVSNVNENNRRNEIKNKYSHKSQGDMFELSQPSPSSGSSRLAACREKEPPKTQESSQASSEITQTVNPFKVQNKEERGSKGLSFFNNVKQSDLKPAKPDAASTEKVTKGKSANPSKDKTNSVPKKMKFFNWFNNRKTALQEKYPDLTMNELTKVAMKLFREEVSAAGKQQQRKEDSENDGDLEQSPESKRLKMEDEKSEVKASVASKLSAFNFVK